MRLYGNPPLTNAEAWELYCGLVAHKRIGFVQEPPGLEGIWQALAAHKTASPKIWMDSYLAAFAVAGRYRLVTLDLAFQQFSDLKVLLLRP